MYKNILGYFLQVQFIILGRSRINAKYEKSNVNYRFHKYIVYFFKTFVNAKWFTIECH